jgi:hypothetical protein
MMTRDTTSRFAADGPDGWRRVADVPASTGIQRSVVERRMAEAIEVARSARLTRNAGPRTSQRRLASAVARLRAGRPNEVAARAGDAAAPGTPRPAACGATGGAARPACQG